MKKTLPSAITLVCALLVIVTMFFGIWPELNMEIDKWYILSGSAACLIGLFNLTHVHIKNIRRKGKDWDLSILLLLLMFSLLTIGLVTGPSGQTYNWVFQVTVVPLGSTFMSILAFYIISASYRAFRAKTRDAVILLAAAVVVLIGRAPIGQAIWPGFEKTTNWIMSIPNTSAMRAVAFGTFIGGLITAVRVVLGLERPYASRTD